MTLFVSLLLFFFFLLRFHWFHGAPFLQDTKDRCHICDQVGSLLNVFKLIIVVFCFAITCTLQTRGVLWDTLWVIKSFHIQYSLMSRRWPFSHSHDDYCHLMPDTSGSHSHVWLNRNPTVLCMNCFLSDFFFLEGGINLISLMQRADLENNAYVT